MKENLPDRPLKPSAFAKEMGLSSVRLVRVARNISPPLRLLEGGEIPVSEYERLYEALNSEINELSFKNDLGKVNEQGSEG